MNIPGKADPAIYPKLREQALQIRLPNLPPNAVHAIVMDWVVDTGTVTVLAGGEGTASIYLSSGGGFIGGSQKYPEIREAALHAVSLATSLMPHFHPTSATDLPPNGTIFFYATTSEGLYLAAASNEALQSGADPLAALGDAMQKIVTGYRLMKSTEQPSH